MTYDKEFEEIIKTPETSPSWTMKDRLWFVWQAARKDHYRIGEKVEAKQIGAQWKEGTVMAGVYSNNNYYIEEPERVRRIPSRSRIDEIAEEAEGKYRRGSVGAGSLTDIIKSAILRALEERIHSANLDA